jgi:hypothetical protein
MEFLLQQGWGMFGLDLEFIRANLASAVVLSPRVYTREQIERHAQELRKLNAGVMFDPQFYDPQTGREKLLSFPYWDDLDFETSTFDDACASTFCERVLRYQTEMLCVTEALIPGRYTNSLSEEWLAMQHGFAETAARLDLGIPIYSTVALGPDIIGSQESLDNVLDEVTGYPVDGVYFVFRAPQNRFFVGDEGVIYNLLSAVLSMRLHGKDVIMGYANQQSLVFAAAGARRMASGNFRNTRHFNPEIFAEQEETAMQRGVWFYHPRSLSDFRLESLRLAFRRGFGELFGPPCDYCRELLQASDPGSVRWGEREAFRHFLFEFGRQVVGFEGHSQRAAIETARQVLGDSRACMEEFRSRAFVLGDRAFDQYIDATEGALEAFVADREADLLRLSEM